MLDSTDQQRLHRLLSDTIPLLCKRTLGYSSELSVEAFIGVTLSDENAGNEVLMVSFKETLLADGRVLSYVWSELPPPSSAGISPPLVEPVAFSISESGHCSRRSSHNGRDGGLEKNMSEFEPSWNNDYWPESDEAAITGAAGGSSKPSSSTSLLSFPIKVEGSDDDNVANVGDERDDLDIDADLETMSDAGNSYENPYSIAVHRYSSAEGPHVVVGPRPNCLPAASHRSSKSFKGSRKLMKRRGLVQTHSFQHLPSSSSSKLHAIVKQATHPPVNTVMQSSHLDVVENGKGLPSMPQYTMFDGVHTPVLIAPTPMQTTPKKRCRVCYAAKKRREVRYCCGTCPERPGLCLEPCFTEFHRSMVSVTAPAFIFSGVDANEPVKSFQRTDSAQGH